jgi:DNA-binding PadR family transcriptional regulator
MGRGELGRWSDPGLLVLASLAEGPKHGYAMVKDIESLAGVHLGPGTLYGALSRLEEQGLIEALEGEGRRRPYRLSPGGRAALADQLQTLAAVADTGLRRLSALGAGA